MGRLPCNKGCYRKRLRDKYKKSPSVSYDGYGNFIIFKVSKIQNKTSLKCRYIRKNVIILIYDDYSMEALDIEEIKIKNI